MRTTLRSAQVRLPSEATVRGSHRTPWQRAPLLPSSVPPSPFAGLLWPFLIVLLTGLTFSLGPAACSSTAAAQAPETTLLRAVVAEATWLERDHRAILHVLARRAERAGLPVDEMARRYVAALKRPIARAWVLELTPECEQPSSWPSSLDWEAHRVQCDLTVERVRAFLAGNSIDPCPGAMHWGARNIEIDVERAARAQWKRVRCDGRTANAFYRYGSRVLTAQEASAR